MLRRGSSNSKSAVSSNKLYRRKMKGVLRRYMASLMAVVYLMAIGSAALSSLLCPCIRQQHTCTQCCCHTSCVSLAVDSCCADATECVKGTCCGQSHATDIALYTAGDEDALRRLWRTMQPLMGALVADCVALATPDCAVERGILLFNDPLVELDSGVSCALRAPPVTA